MLDNSCSWLTYSGVRLDVEVLEPIVCDEDELLEAVRDAAVGEFLGVEVDEHTGMLTFERANAPLMVAAYCAAHHEWARFDGHRACPERGSERGFLDCGWAF